ncbi:hypothetical protein LRP88_09451 [Fusarium phalaenopsidis]
MPLPIRDVQTTETFDGYLADFNVSIPLKTAKKTLPDDPLLLFPEQKKNLSGAMAGISQLQYQSPPHYQACVEDRNREP